MSIASQLLRQASRLANLNKKLIGENQVGQDGVIQEVPSIDELGPSIYGDTLFDNTILPRYVAFIRNLVVARRQTQESFHVRFASALHRSPSLNQKILYRTHLKSYLIDDCNYENQSVIHGTLILMKASFKNKSIAGTTAKH